MFKLLIADDEAGSREWLAQEIPWEDHDICLVGPAADGGEAWRLFQEEQPELVLTDIRMPGMDGIELARAALALNPRTRIIVISGHDEFTYAKACLEIGVSGYILKPSPPEEILGAILKEREALLARQVDEAVWASFRAQLQENIPFLREQFLRDLCRGVVETEDLPERLRFLQVPAAADRPLCVLILEVKDNVDFHLRHGEKERQLIWLMLHDLARTAMGESGCAVRLEQGGVAALFFGYPDRAEHLAGDAARLAQILLDQARTALPCALAIGIGGTAAGLRDCHRSFMEAKQALAIQDRFKVESFADHAHCQAGGQDVPCLSIVEEERLGLHLENGDAAETVQPILRRLLAPPAADQAASAADRRRESGWILAGALIRIAQRNGLTAREFLPAEDYAVLARGGPEGEPGEAARWWEAQFGRLGGALRTLHNNGWRVCIRKAREYIEANLGASISLSRVAREVYMSPSYLSRLFKEQTGESFSAYVARRKMEEARRLLDEGEKKIYEIAAAVGFTDPAYFGRVFRQFYNVTPTEYKEGSRPAG